VALETADANPKQSHGAGVAALGVEEQPYRGGSVKLTIEVAAG
jgi:hypothetical protein